MRGNELIYRDIGFSNRDLADFDAWLCLGTKHHELPSDALEHLSVVRDGCRVRCPFHRAEFDIRTGEVHKWANFPPGIQVLNVVRSEKALKAYPVVVEAGEVAVEV